MFLMSKTMFFFAKKSLVRVFFCCSLGGWFAPEFCTIALSHGYFFYYQWLLLMTFCVLEKMIMSVILKNLKIYHLLCWENEVNFYRFF